MLGVILAGGRSSRMGRDKAFLELAGETLVARAVRRFGRQVPELVISSNADAGLFSSFDLPVVSDEATGYQGPLAGIHAAMEWARANRPEITHVGCIAVDTPFFPADFRTRLVEAATGAGLVPVVAESLGHQHPTFGLYPVALADDIASFLASGERRVMDFLARNKARRLAFRPLTDASGETIDPFFNVNTPADLSRAEEWARSAPHH